MSGTAGSATIDCDVLVVGAGPAGSVAAREAAVAGARVVLVDRRPRVGKPARCAGFLPAAAARKLEFVQLPVLQQIETMEVRTPGGSRLRLNSPGFIVERELLDRRLAAAAADAGALLITGCRARPDGAGADCRRAGGEGLRIDAPVIVGADGPLSPTALAAGFKRQKCVRAAQVTLDPGGGGRALEIFHEPVFSGGYGWFFPAGDSCRVGVAVDGASGITAPEAIKYLLGRVSGRLPRGRRLLATTGGLVPVSGKVSPGRGNIILAGDAAGLCHPLTGAGIAAALESGAMAGAAAAGAAAGDTGALERYRRELAEIYGSALERARERRKEIESSRRLDALTFSLAVRRGWALAGKGAERERHDLNALNLENV